MRASGNKVFLLPAIFVIAAGEFALDIFTPNGVSDWVFYFIPLLLSSYIGVRRLPYLLAGIFSILCSVGYCLSPADAHTSYSLAGRLVGVSAFWIIAAVISWHKKTEGSLQRADRALKMISECNRLLVRATNEPALLHELCRLIVEQGGYRMAWVGFAEADKSVRIASSAGDDDGYLAKAKVTWDDNEHGRGPIGVAFRTGQLVVCNDFQTSATTQPWHEEAAKCAYAAAIALPLKCTGKTFGVLALYASVVNSFTSAEVALLAEMADDLAFGIHTLRARAEHQQAATALQESDREIFNSTSEAILLHEVGTGKILDVNDATLRMFGYDSKAEVLANTVADMSAMEPAYTQMEVQHNIRRAMEEGPQTFEWQARKKNGENFWVEVSLRSSQIGGQNRVISALRDITERRKTEAQLRQLSLAVEQCPVMIIITDATGRIEYVNPKFTEVTGYTFHEVHGQNPRILKSGHTPREFYRQLWQNITAGQTWRGEMLNRKKNGETFWESASISPITNHAGKITGYLGVKDDITRDKLAAEKIQEQAAMLNLAHDAITIRDLDNRITYWNRSAERIYGWSNAEAVGQIASELLKLDSFGVTEAWRQLLANGFWMGELTSCNKAGHEVLIEATWTLVRTVDGQPKAVFATSVDITNARKLLQQVARSQRIESLGTLASGVAHDLNNILTPIMVSISLLKEQVHDPKFAHLLAGLDNSTQRGAQLVKQILTFGRVAKGEHVPLNVREIAHEIEQLVRETFPKSIQLEINAPEKLWHVIGDHTQLHQVFLNLAINARDAMPAGGKLTFTFENHDVDPIYAGLNPEARSGPHLLIQVVDTGSGISQKIIGKIFDPFFTTKPPGTGTGLGLSTSLGIIKSHGGFINVYSELGKGSTFKIYLPAQASGEQAEQQAVSQSGLPLGHNELILFVDDEQVIRTVVQKILERHGYRVLTAANGAEAVSLYAAQGQEIAVVITDMHMPIMDGPATIIALQTLNPRVKIIGSSGLAANGGVAKAASAGVRHFLPKPYTAEKMLHTIRLFLDERSDTENAPK
jgi:PAS domain S-box-containing protein